MIYCQHLAGMGHLVRCQEIIGSLIEDFEVCFISGGQRVPQFRLPPAVEVIYLPALWQRGAELLPVDESMSLADVQAQRKQMLIDAFNDFQPDCLMTECFPFSKLSMKAELKPLLKAAKASGRPVRIVCSLRDLVMTQPFSPEVRERREAKIARLINRFYDAILFHADSRFQRLEDCFAVERLNCEMVYTGYVAQSPPANTPSDEPDFQSSAPMIVVSAGGGRHGYPLLSAAIAASTVLKNQLPHQFHLFAGPFMPEEEFNRLQQSAAGKENVVLRRYTPWLLDYLEAADLSISLGGYNTTMNLLRTGVRSLLLPSLNPSQTDEQRIRAEKLSSLGLLTLLSPGDLSPDCLSKAIVTALDKPRSTHEIDLQGATHTANYLKKLLNSVPVALAV